MRTWRRPASALAAGLLALAALPGAARAAQSFIFSSGGTMSTSLRLTVDLDDGAFVLSEGPIDLDRSKAATTRSGTLDRAALAALKARIRTGKARGWESKACRTARLRSHREGTLHPDHPATPDYMASFTIRLADESFSAPGDPGCWTQSAHDMVNAAIDAARARGR